VSSYINLSVVNVLKAASAYSPTFPNPKIPELTYVVKKEEIEEPWRNNKKYRSNSPP